MSRFITPGTFTEKPALCTPCRKDELKRNVYRYARNYLCELHKSQWDEIDAREHRNGCPHTPQVCPVFRCHKAAASGGAA